MSRVPRSLLLPLALVTAGVGLAGTLDVNTNSAFVGTYGLEVGLTDTSPAYVQDDTPAAEPRYRARFYVRLDGLSFGASPDEFELFTAYSANGDAQLRLAIRWNQALSERRLVYTVREDSGLEVPVTPGNEILLTGGWHAIEVDWRAATALQTDGHLGLWVDGEVQLGLVGLDNDLGRIDYVRWGAVDGIDLSTGGSMHFDAFESRRDRYIGLLAGAPSSFYTLTPCRLVDTRGPAGPLGGPVLTSGQPRTFDLAGNCGIPASATSVSVNITVVGPTGQGFLTLYPGGATIPATSTVNFAAGQVRANNSILQLSTDLNGTLAVSPSVVAGGLVHFILDVNGYFRQ